MVTVMPDISLIVAWSLLLAAGAWDLYVLRRWGDASGLTASWQLYSDSRKRPVIALVFGVLLCWMTAWTVADGDLSPIDDGSGPQLLDVAELRLLKSVLGWLSSPDQKVSLGEQKLGAFRKDLADEVAAILAQLREQYGYGVASVTAGRVDLNFAQTEPCETEPLPIWEG